MITNQTTADDPSDYGKEWTRGREKFAPVAAGGGDGQEKCITSGAYHLEITADGSNTKIIYKSTAPEDLQVVVRGKEEQQTFAFTASSEKKIEEIKTKPTSSVAMKAEQAGNNKEGDP